MSDDTSRLRLKYGAGRAQEILQIEMRRKHGAKFARTLSENSRFVFPSSLAAEQATSDVIADFHATLIDDGWVVADLTSGLGIDAMAFARKAKAVVAIERNVDVAEALRGNSQQLGNIEVITGDCRDIIGKWIAEGRRFDAVFVDPARRGVDGRRLFALSDCEPDVVAMMPDLGKITSRLIVKASPMLDITHTVRELHPCARQIIIVGTTTECKELLAVCDIGDTLGVSEPVIRAVTIGPELYSEFSFTRSEEAGASATYGVPGNGDCILEPYPAVMKSAPYDLLAQRFGVKKLGSNTHLWFAPAPVEGFPGAPFRVVDVTPYMSKNIKRYASRFPRVSVTARNFDINASTLKAKLNVSDGPMRLFAVNAFDGRKLLITCEKIL